MSDDPDPSAPHRRSTAIERPLALGFIGSLGVLGGIVLGSAMGSISTILVFILLAMFVAVGLDPVVVALGRHRVPRAAGVGIVFGSFLLLITLFLVFVLPPVVAQVAELASAIPEMARELQRSDWYLALSEPVRLSLDAGIAQLRDTLRSPDTIAAIGGGVLAIGVGALNVASATFTVVALTLYFMASLPVIKRGFYLLAPARNRARLQDFTERITASVGASLIGSVTLAGINAAVVFALHLLIGLPFPALMALIAFVVTLVPLFGSIIFLVFATAIALFSSPLQALIFLIAYLVYIQIESYLLSPRIMNRAISIPAALVLIGALLGAALMGIAGVLVALPVMASLLLILREVVVPRQDLKV